MTKREKIRFAIGKNDSMWHDRFARAFENKIEQGEAVDYAIVDIEHDDWIEALDTYDVVIWKPAYLGAVSAGYLKEKIYFIEKYLGKVVIPNFNSVWHFESKIAQSYLFKHEGTLCPRTTVTFTYGDALKLIEKAEMPVILKESFGAGSKNVRMIRSKRELRNIASINFCQQLWDEGRRKMKSTRGTIVRFLNKRWVWAKILKQICGRERFGVMYWQEFVPGNAADLRITVIGDRFAYAFWRKNRPKDFRASGSGLLDYSRNVPEECLRYCLSMNKKLSFDSMAYDILFDKAGRFLVVEMSYGYVDAALYQSSGYFELLQDGRLVFRQGHVWPQELWVEWAIIRAKQAAC